MRTATSRNGGVFSIELIAQRPGLVQFAATGPTARLTFEHEGGGHRWQRVPPTEKRGRVQTSTVTVAVMDLDAVVGIALDPRDVDIATARGSGPGGQKRNTTESCVIATHRPTGTQVRIDNERSQHQNRALALKALAARLYAEARTEASALKNDDRRKQVGTGQRGDKVRTYRVQDNQVTDHSTGIKGRLNRWCEGDW